MAQRRQKHKEKKAIVKQRRQKQKEKKAIVKENIKVKFLCIYSMLDASIIFSAVWALVRWVWLEFGLFPNVKTAIAELVIPLILSIIYYIVTLTDFISSIKYSIERFVRGSACFLSLLLFVPEFSYKLYLKLLRDRHEAGGAAYLGSGRLLP